MVNPETGDKEWIELYNNNDFDVILSSWYIDDVENKGSSPKLLPLSIAAHAYAVFDISSSLFNNDGDDVRLLDQNKIEKDSFEYEESERGKTIGRINFDNDTYCLQTPSKNFVNNGCLAVPSPTPSPIPKALSPTTKSQLLALLYSTPIAFSRSKLFSSQSQTLPTQEIPRRSIQQDNDTLGASTTINLSPKDDQVASLNHTFSFLSFSYSLLTITSIFLKMKVG